VLLELSWDVARQNRLLRILPARSAARGPGPGGTWIGVGVALQMQSRAASNFVLAVSYIDMFLHFPGPCKWFKKLNRYYAAMSIA
jgi:hypothetical protein